LIERVIDARPRDVGGFSVGRVLPAIGRKFVGPFVFLDHMLPVDNVDLQVRPHPHIHLGTVTYLFDGEIMHRDSIGSQQLITPGAINWMNAGRGIVHSERAPSAAGHHHGIQLWVGLPRAHEDSDPAFAHYPAQTLPVVGEVEIKARVLLGRAFGALSPVETQWPMFYVDLAIEGGARVRTPGGYTDRAVYVIDGSVTIDGQRIEPRTMAVFDAGSEPVLETDAPAHVVLLGGEPLDGPRYIWWNFVSSSPERIIEAAHAWRERKFAAIPDDNVEFIPAPDDDPRFAHG
jgi:redox-sensitive bicupin YhaK (pirin superfamily)